MPFSSNFNLKSLVINMLASFSTSEKYSFWQNYFTVKWNTLTNTDLQTNTNNPTNTPECHTKPELQLSLKSTMLNVTKIRK